MDRVQQMLARQKEREEKMKQKEEEKRQKELADKQKVKVVEVVRGGMLEPQKREIGPRPVSSEILPQNTSIDEKLC